MDKYIQLDATDKVLVWTLRIIRILLVVSAVLALITLHWMEIFVSLVVLAMTYIADLVQRWYGVKIPLEIEVYMVVLIYASIFLGELHDFYGIFWWWDSVMHFTAAIVFGFIGFLIMYTIYHRHKLEASASLIALFAFCFSMTIGAMWEVFEFIMDQSFDLTMQPSGFDTMVDLILNAIGAAITSTVGYFYIKREETGVFRRLVHKFMRDNPQLAKTVARKN
ncbi:MAG: hypothetical protein WD061_03355 [Candidatus Saccharimonadales bacterium]